MMSRKTRKQWIQERQEQQPQPLSTTLTTAADAAITTAAAVAAATTATDTVICFACSQYFVIDSHSTFFHVFSWPIICAMHKFEVLGMEKRWNCSNCTLGLSYEHFPSFFAWLQVMERSPLGRFVRFNRKLGSGSYKVVFLGFDNDTGSEGTSWPRKWLYDVNWQWKNTKLLPTYQQSLDFGRLAFKSQGDPAKERIQPLPPFQVFRSYFRTRGFLSS
jgi:hypothetical protein